MDLAFGMVIVFILGTCFGAFVTYKSIELAFDSVTPLDIEIEKETP